MRATLVRSTTASWLMALAYDRIEVMSGVEVHWLLALATVTIVGGLIFGLFVNVNDFAKKGVPAK